MISPCPRCGATKIDPVPHDIKYELVWAFGYRLQRCSRCRAARYIPRNRGESRGSSPVENEPQSTPWLKEERGTLGTADASPELNKHQVSAADSSERDVRHCPVCGSTGYRRTRRTTKERVLRVPPMARCESCGLRFPYPGHREKYPEPMEPAGAAATGSRFTEEGNAPDMANEKGQSEASTQVTPAGSLYADLLRCPACGSKKHHRTQRTKLERMLQRPPMGRCESCGKRFPYLTRHNESPDPVESTEAKASINHMREEGRGSGATEVSAQANVEKHGTAADSLNRELSRCPFCGSTAYRRSRRNTLEHLLLRPKMARCSHCRKRFPFPER
jgi:hypothetical protein